MVKMHNFTGAFRFSRACLIFIHGIKEDFKLKSLFGVSMRLLITKFWLSFQKQDESQGGHERGTQLITLRSVEEVPASMQFPD
jgi:hypothetical protein